MTLDDSLKDQLLIEINRKQVRNYLGGQVYSTATPIKPHIAT